MALLQHFLQTHTDSCRNSEPISHTPARRQLLSYPERVNAGLKVVGDGVRLEKGVVRDGADGVAFAMEFLLQLQGLLEAGVLGRRLGAGVEQRGVGSICSN